MNNAQELVRRTVITKVMANNENLAINYNGHDCVEFNERIEALRHHYRRSVLRKYGITLREEDEDGQLVPCKNNLVVNGMKVTVKIPQPLRDEEDDSITETLEEYYNRTRLKASGLYRSFMKGLEGIDFLGDMN